MRRLVLLCAAVSLAACGGDDGGAAQAELPRADLIAPALDAIGEARGEPVEQLELVEVAASLTGVDVLVAGQPGQAVLYRYDGELTGPVEPRPDERATFAASEVGVDPDSVFDELRDELPDSAIIDLAVHDDGGVVVTDATVASENGGVLLVLLQPDGSIIGMQQV